MSSLEDIKKGLVAIKPCLVDAYKQIPKDITEKFNELPWFLMAKMRDYLIRL